MNSLPSFLMQAAAIVVCARNGKLFHAGRLWMQLHTCAKAIHETEGVELAKRAYQLVWALDRALEER